MEKYGLGIRRHLLLWVLTIPLAMGSVWAQEAGFAALRNEYPLLVDKFGNELTEQRADYIFAIDVSGTMGKYKEIVVPALDAFFHSLQDGDYVSVIKFGGEATNEVGSSGKINPETVGNLKAYLNHLYEKPTTQYELEKYYKWTDLDNMLHYVADDLHQIDRNNLKFVFIITDFMHDPAKDRKGKEDWDGVARQLAREQASNDVYVFALQLPGAGRDVEKVRNVFPKYFHFDHVSISSGNALSDWFTQRKNSILRDKFRALIMRKIQPSDFTIDPALDLDGHLSLTLSWSPNQVFDVLRVNGVDIQGKGMSFESRLPETVRESEICLEAGRVSYTDASLLKPTFRQFNHTIVAEAGFDVPYVGELNKLNIETPVVHASAEVSRRLFCYPLPFWLFCVIIALILLYIILVIRAFSRNSSSVFRINGKFEVTRNGVAITEKATAKRLERVDFGNAASFLPVPGCRWTISILVKRYNPFFLFLKSPVYVIHMTNGRGFNAKGVNWGPHQKPTIPRYTRISIPEQQVTYQIRWIEKS